MTFLKTIPFSRLIINSFNNKLLFPIFIDIKKRCCYSKKTLYEKISFKFISKNKIHCNTLKKIDNHISIKLPNKIVKWQGEFKKGNIFFSFTQKKASSIPHKNILIKKNNLLTNTHSISKKTSTISEYGLFEDENSINKINYSNKNVYINKQELKNYLSMKEEEKYFKILNKDDCEEVTLLEEKDTNDSFSENDYQVSSIFKTLKDYFNI